MLTSLSGHAGAAGSLSFPPACFRPRAGRPAPWASPPSPSLSARRLLATGLPSALLLSLTPSSRAAYGPPTGDTVRDGGSAPGHQLCLALVPVFLGSGATCWQSRRARAGSGEDAKGVCMSCFGRVLKNFAPQLLCPAPRGACAISAGMWAQGGDSVPGFWGHPESSPP